MLKRSNYQISYNGRLQNNALSNRIDSSIDSNLYFLLDGEQVAGFAVMDQCPPNEIPHPRYAGTRMVYRALDRSLYEHKVINTFSTNFHPGSSFKYLPNMQYAPSRSGKGYFFLPVKPSVPNIVYVPNFKFRLNNFSLHASLRINPLLPNASIFPHNMSLVGTSSSPENQGWYTTISISPAVDNTAPYLFSSSSNSIIDKDINNKYDLILNFNTPHQTLSYIFPNFQFNTWFDVAISYSDTNNILILSINNSPRYFYNIRKFSTPDPETFNLVIGPVVPDFKQYMGSIDNFYIKKYL